MFSAFGAILEHDDMDPGSYRSWTSHAALSYYEGRGIGKLWFREHEVSFVIGNHNGSKPW